MGRSLLRHSNWNIRILPFWKRQSPTAWAHFHRNLQKSTDETLPLLDQRRAEYRSSRRQTAGSKSRIMVVSTMAMWSVWYGVNNGGGFTAEPNGMDKVDGNWIMFWRFSFLRTACDSRSTLASTTEKANMPLTPDCFVCNLRYNGRTLYFLSIPASLQRQKYSTKKVPSLFENKLHVKVKTTLPSCVLFRDHQLQSQQSYGEGNIRGWGIVALTPLMRGGTSEANSPSTLP
jgi:hypothetical protein